MRQNLRNLEVAINVGTILQKKQAIFLDMFIFLKSSAAHHVLDGSN